MSSSFISLILLTLFSYLRLPQCTILKNGLICMLDIRAYVILQLDFPLCLVIVEKNEINSLLPSGGNYCCYTWTDKLLLRHKEKCRCYAWTGKLLLRSGGKCCCHAWNDKLRPGRIRQLGQTGKNQTQCHDATSMKLENVTLHILPGLAFDVIIGFPCIRKHNLITTFSYLFSESNLQVHNCTKCRQCLPKVFQQESSLCSQGYINSSEHT